MTGRGAPGGCPMGRQPVAGDGKAPGGLPRAWEHKHAVAFSGRSRVAYNKPNAPVNTPWMIVRRVLYAQRRARYQGGHSEAR